MTDATPPIAVVAAEVPPRARASNYPADLVDKIGGRQKTILGELFGLRNFGVNLTRLPPGSASALRHAHEKQDEFVYILEGDCILVTDAGETPLGAGMCAGFRAATGDAHHLVNRGCRRLRVSRDRRPHALRVRGLSRRRPDGPPRRGRQKRVFPQGRHAHFLKEGASCPCCSAA